MNVKCHPLAIFLSSVLCLLSYSMGLVLHFCSASTSQIPSVVHPGVSQAFGNSEFPIANILSLDLVHVTFVEKKWETLQQQQLSLAIVWESVPKAVHWIIDKENPALMCPLDLVRDNITQAHTNKSYYQAGQ